MKFEKLSENKIKITLSNQDLAEKHIDFHSFMANSIESQDLFLDVLAKAEKEVGFITRDYKIKIEAFAVSDGDFIITITRFSQEYDREKGLKKKVNIHRKKVNLTSPQVIYTFFTFDDFCEYVNFAFPQFFQGVHSVAKNISLYTYKNIYYLVFSGINPLNPDLNRFYSSLTEFGTYVNTPELFSRKLIESGKLIMKNNAVKTCYKYFHS